MALAIVQMVCCGQLVREPLAVVELKPQLCQRSMAWAAVLAVEAGGYLIPVQMRRLSSTLFELTYERPFCHDEWRVRRVRLKWGKQS